MSLTSRKCPNTFLILKTVLKGELIMNADGVIVAPDSLKLLYPSRAPKFVPNAVAYCNSPFSRLALGAKLWGYSRQSGVLCWNGTAMPPRCDPGT